MKEIEQIIKLLQVVNYTPASEGQQGATDDEKSAALNRAATKLARLKLKVMDLDELKPEPLPPVREPTYYPGVPVYTTTTSTGFGGNTVTSVHVIFRTVVV